jgi:NAD(P)-dependent dehydrogenase (short-subunit alcohol dehydrogenase family)
MRKMVWFITGAGRGLGSEVAKAALAAGDQVVATGRKLEAVSEALGASEDLLTLRLDVTREDEAHAAVRAALEWFGRIDVLVNNAGYGQLGFFEELAPGQIERQFATNVHGAMTVTRAVLPHMRVQRSGHVITISSIAGLIGAAGGSAYHASKFAVEGWMECLHKELAPLGIVATVVEPGFFRTDFLDSSSVAWGEILVDDYAERSAEFRLWHDAKNQAQEGDPVKLARALLTLVEAETPPRRFVAGADAIRLADEELRKRLWELDAWRELSVSLSYEGTEPVTDIP